jgi:hypothetical protein
MAFFPDPPAAAPVAEVVEIFRYEAGTEGDGGRCWDVSADVSLAIKIDLKFIRYVQFDIISSQELE